MYVFYNNIMIHAFKLDVGKIPDSTDSTSNKMFCGVNSVVPGNT